MPSPITISAMLGLHPTAGNVILISRPAKSRRLSLPEHAVGSQYVISSGTDLISLLIWLLLLLFSLIGATSAESLKLRRFKSDRDEARREYSSRKHDRVGFSI